MSEKSQPTTEETSDTIKAIDSEIRTIKKLDKKPRKKYSKSTIKKINKKFTHDRKKITMAIDNMTAAVIEVLQHKKKPRNFPVEVQPPALPTIPAHISNAGSGGRRSAGSDLQLF